MKKNRLLTIMLIILLTITLVGVVGVVLVTQLTKDTDKTERTIDEIITASVDVPELTTNLADDRIIRIALKIETDSEEAAEELTKRDFQTSDLIIEELSELEKEDLKGKQGKAMFEAAIKAQINKLMQKGEVQQVYITSCIIQ